MGREVRRVPANWEHPRDGHGHLIPLHDGYSKRVAEWDQENAKWKEGLRSDWSGGWQVIEEKHRGMSFSEWGGERPEQNDYMPDWPTEERTHYQMYEITSEGTPISPVMDSPERLARWLAETGASAFAGQGATFEEWLGMIGEGSAPSAVMSGGVMQSGVAALGLAAFKRDHDWPDVIE